MMEKKLKIIYATPSPLTERWLGNYCLDELKDIFDLEFWDCSQMTDPSFKTQKILSRPYVTIIRNLNELENKLIKTPKDAVRIIDIQKNEHNLPIHELFAKYSDLCIFIHCFGAVQVMEIINPDKDKNIIQKVFSKKVIKRVRNKIKFIQTMPVRKEYEHIYKNYWITSVLSDEFPYRINHPDYERYRESLKEPSLFKGERYVVYIDNNFPVHTDIRIREPYLNVEEMAPKFYASLNNFFTRIEERYNCKVKIAGHPIAQYSVNPYGGREILYDKTVELVKDALAVCIHTSNAFSYVVLFNKPVALLYNAVYTQAKIEYGRLQGEAQRLRLPLVNTDDPLPKQGSVFSRLDKNIADNYKNTYLIADPNQTNAQLYTKIFREIYNDWQKPKH